MWARAVEVMLGLWLLVSPFIFGHYGQRPPLVMSDLGAGAAVILLSLATFAPSLRRAHLLNLLVAAWLVGFGRFGFPHPAPAGAQNQILVGLVLLLLAIVPPESSRPPLSWRRHLAAEAERARSRQRARHDDAR